jgi:seryl-tRNA synthetase
MIISVAAVTGLLGSILYFYKKSNALQAELEKLAEHLAGTARKVGELQTQGRDLVQLVEAIKQLNAFVNQHDAGLRELKESLDPLNEEIEDFHFVIDQMIEAFKDQGIDIEREPRRRRKNPRSARGDTRSDNRSTGRSGRRAAKPVSDSESESEEEEPVPSRRTARKPEARKPEAKPTKPAKPAKPSKPAKPAKVEESEDDEEESDADVAAAAAIAASRRQK